MPADGREAHERKQSGARQNNLGQDDRIPHAHKPLACEYIDRPFPDLSGWKRDFVGAGQKALPPHRPGEDFVGEKAGDVLPRQGCLFGDEGEGESDVYEDESGP